MSDAIPAAPPAPTPAPTPAAVPGLAEKEIPDDEITISVTPGSGIPGAPAAKTGTPTKPTPTIPDRDHAFLPLLDIAIDQSLEYCEKEGLPRPNLSLWENFSRPYMNRALWHYCPDDLPDSPALCLILGSAGIGIMYVPVIMALVEKGQKEEKKAKPPKTAPGSTRRADLPPEEPPEPPANVRTWTDEEPPEEPTPEEEPVIELAPDILARMQENGPTPTGL